jgi:molybdopterin converting factor small subunit
MAITVLLPNELRPYVAYNDRVALDAETVQQALDKLMQRYPDLATYLPRDLMRLPPGYAIYRNSVDIRRLQGLDTALDDADRVTIVVPEGDL